MTNPLNSLLGLIGVMKHDPTTGAKNNLKALPMTYPQPRPWSATGEAWMDWPTGLIKFQTFFSNWIPQLIKKSVAIIGFFIWIQLTLIPMTLQIPSGQKVSKKRGNSMKK